MRCFTPETRHNLDICLRRGYTSPKPDKKSYTRCPRNQALSTILLLAFTHSPLGICTHIHLLEFTIHILEFTHFPLSICTHIHLLAFTHSPLGICTHTHLLEFAHRLASCYLHIFLLAFVFTLHVSNRLINTKKWGASYLKPNITFTHAQG